MNQENIMASGTDTQLVFIFTDEVGNECRDSFAITDYLLWNIPRYMVGRYEENWLDEKLKTLKPDHK